MVCVCVCICVVVENEKLRKFLVLNEKLHQESAFLVVFGRRRHMSPPPANRIATMNVGAGQYVSRSVAMTTKRIKCC